MFALLSPRLWIALAIAGLLATSHFAAYRSGRAAVRVLWDADVALRTTNALQAEQAARKREAELQTKVGKVDRAYQDQKRATATVAAAAAVGMRNLEAALAVKPNSGASAPSGADDPRDRIIAECAGTVVALDAAYRRLANKATALQDYASGVCVGK